MSLRRRLLLGLVAVAAVLVVTNLVLAQTIESYLLDRLDQQLVDVASRPFFRGGPGGPGRPPGEDRALSEYFLAVGDPDATAFRQVGSVLADAGEAPPRLERAAILAHLSGNAHHPSAFTAPAASGGGAWRLVAVTDQRGSINVIGIGRDQVDGTVDRIRVIQILGTAAVLAALGLVSFWMLRLGVHPLEAMARDADAIAEGDLSRRVEHPGRRTEAGRLGTALNSMLERIEESFRAREASEERVRRFAADASHELRTPLTSIRGYAELWRAGALRGDDELAGAMRRMEEEATRMGRLVEDLLLLARLDQRRPLEHAPVRLDLLAADAVADARAVEPDRPLALTTEPVTVVGDEMRLRQVLANLVANVREHTPPGTQVTVTVTADRASGRLEVADQGPGLAPDVAAKVFERFYRADTARTRAAGGTGLGLSIVAAIVEAHGGEASVASEPGQGSRFAVLLPRLGAEDTSQPDGADSHPVHSLLPAAGRILAVAPTSGDHDRNHDDNYERDESTS